MSYKAYFLKKHYFSKNKIFCSDLKYINLFLAYLLTIKKEKYILLLWRKCSLKLDSNKSGFWKTHFTACYSVYLYLLKSMFLFQWYFRVPKLKKIVRTHSPKRDFIIFTVSENSFQNILIFFASNWKISISGAKFFILFIVPQKCTKNWPVIYWPAKEIHITKNQLIGFF